MELAISKLTARRVIYYFEGYVKGERPNTGEGNIKKIVLVFPSSSEPD